MDFVFVREIVVGVCDCVKYALDCTVELCFLPSPIASLAPGTFPSSFTKVLPPSDTPLLPKAPLAPSDVRSTTFFASCCFVSSEGGRGPLMRRPVDLRRSGEMSSILLCKVGHSRSSITLWSFCAAF